MSLQLLQDTAKAISEGRSRVQLLQAVAIDKSPSELRALGASSVTDCFTDPCGWLPTSTPAGDTDAGSIQWRDLQLLRQLLQPGAIPALAAGGSCCLVLAGLSTLLLRHPAMQVRWQPHRSSTSAVVGEQHLQPLHAVVCHCSTVLHGVALAGPARLWPASRGHCHAVHAQCCPAGAAAAASTQGLCTHLQHALASSPSKEGEQEEG